MQGDAVRVARAERLRLEAALAPAAVPADGEVAIVGIFVGPAAARRIRLVRGRERAAWNLAEVEDGRHAVLLEDLVDGGADLRARASGGHVKILQKHARSVRGRGSDECESGDEVHGELRHGGL